MILTKSTLRLKGFRFPFSVISYAVWAYHRFNLSLRDVEDLLAERGVTVSYETIRVWVTRFGPNIAREIRRARPDVTGKWHLDEVVIVIRGEKHWLWRAVDSEGTVLDIMVQKRRNAFAAKRFVMKLVCRWGKPRVIITDKLGSYGVAIRLLLPTIDHRQHKGLNNRAEASHRHSRRREKISGGFKSMEHAQRSLETHDQASTLFRTKRHRLNATDYRTTRINAFEIWNQLAANIAS